MRPCWHWLRTCQPLPSGLPPKPEPENRRPIPDQRSSLYFSVKAEPAVQNPTHAAAKFPEVLKARSDLCVLAKPRQLKLMPLDALRIHVKHQVPPIAIVKRYWE